MAGLLSNLPGGRVWRMSGYVKRLTSWTSTHGLTVALPQVAIGTFAPQPSHEHARHSCDLVLQRDSTTYMLAHNFAGAPCRRHRPPQGRIGHRRSPGLRPGETSRAPP